MATDERIEFRATLQEREQWDHMASQSMTSLSQWMRMTLNASAKRGRKAWTLEQQRLVDAGYRPEYIPGGAIHRWVKTESGDEE